MTRRRSARAVAATAALLLGAAPPVPAAPVPASRGGPITPADIMRLRDMRDAQLSPDGRTVLFTVQAQMSTFAPERSTIWAVPADASAPARPFAVSAGADDTPRWSPDGRQIAFLSNRKNPLTGGADTGFAFKPDAAAGPGAPVEAVPPQAADLAGEPSRQLWLIAADGGEAVPLTALPGDIAGFEWSPDGRRIAFLSADPDTPAEQADKVVKRDWTEVDHPRHVTRLWVLDLASHVARRVSPPDVNVSAVAWSPDGRRVAVRLANTASINDYFYHSRIALLNPLTGVVGATLIEHAAEGPRWAPDGGAILGAVIRQPGFIGVSPVMFDLGTNRLVDLAADYPASLTQPRWAPDGRSIVALSFEHTRSKLVRIARYGGRVTPIAALDGEAADVTMSRDGRSFAVPLSSPDRPADVWVVRDGRARVLTRINPEVASWRLGAVREISWKSSIDGHPIYGVLVTPPGYASGAPIKTVVQVHGGPEWAWWSGWLGSWHEWAQLLATHGYAVLLPNPRGSDGQGVEFARAVRGDWGGRDYQDILDGVDLLVAQHIADPDRLGIGGWSYGGFMAAWAVGHGARFKAAVVGAGLTDLAAMARSTDTPDFTGGYYGEPSANLARLDRASPVRFVDHVAAPVLVLHGGEDTRVPPTQGLEFYRGLKLLGKPAEMVRYPREPHWFHEPEHQADVQRRVLAWFDRYL